MEQAVGIPAGPPAGRRSVLGRVVELKGFSTLPVDEMVFIDETGTFHGQLLGRPGADQLIPAALDVLSRSGDLQKVGVEIHGREVQELGLACGGRAEVLLQPVDRIPEPFWAQMASRAPTALVTVVEGPGAGPAALAVAGEGQHWGSLSPAVEPETVEALTGEATALLREGRTARRRVETSAGTALIEAWVPDPRLVVVGTGEVVTALEAQAALLSWEVRAIHGVTAGELEHRLDWAGDTGALIVLSHDPDVDVPALASGLARRIPYIGAMGSRGTQSRRLQRLRDQGLPEDQIDRIHRPIGLDLGGRRAPEVALAIVAEILACRSGRDGGPLRQASGPIHG